MGQGLGGGGVHRLKLLGVKDGAQLDASATYVRALYVIAKVLELMDEKAIIEGN